MSELDELVERIEDKHQELRDESLESGPVESQGDLMQAQYRNGQTDTLHWVLREIDRVKE